MNAGFTSSSSLPDPCEPGNELFMVRAAPVDPAAVGAPQEMVVILERAGLVGQWCKDLLFGFFPQDSIAVQAAAQRGGFRQPRETPEDLPGLLFGIVGTRAVAVADDGMHQQAAVAGEQGAMRHLP